MIEWMVFAATGKALIYLWMLFPFPPFIKMPAWLEKLHTCDLCSGTWIYGILALALKMDFVSQIFGVAPNIVGEFCTAAITTFVVHIFSIGWKSKFEVVVIE